MEPDFDKKDLERRLSSLTFHQQCMFGLSCCERLFPNYELFYSRMSWGDPAVFRQALDSCWLFVTGSAIDIDFWQEGCWPLIPDTEDFGSVYVSFGLDAGVAIVSLLDFIETGDLSSIVDIATVAVDSVDMAIPESLDIDPDYPDLEAVILAHPLMQAELENQRLDLDMLGASCDLRVFSRKRRVQSGNIGLMEA